MLKKRFIAFYDVVFFSIISSIMVTSALTIMILGLLNDWYFVVIYALCISIPFTAMFCLQRVTIEPNCGKVDFFYLVNYAKNEKDLNSNWIIYPSEIENISVVKLTNEEKRRYTSARFLFSKYLKVEMRYGHIKYIYVSHYSKNQINKIIKMLSKNKLKH